MSPGWYDLPHHRWLLRTSWLVILESLLRLVQPWLIGGAINDLLQSSYRGLLLFAVAYLSWMLARAARQTSQNRLQESGVSVEFLAKTVPHWLQTGITMVGVLAMLGWYDLPLVPVCLLLLLPVGLLQVATTRRLRLLKNRCAGEGLSVSDIPAVGTSEGALPPQSLRESGPLPKSDTDAVKDAILELFVLGLLATALVHTCQAGSHPIPAGDLFAVLTYVLMFVNGLRDVSSTLTAHRFARVPAAGGSANFFRR